MKIYEAIKQMHELTRQGKSFSFSFMTYSYDKNISHGPRCVQHAILLQSHASKFRYSDFMLRFRDLDTYEEKHFWLPLMLSFNDELIELT